jgi:hypothetical protein
MFPIRRLSYTVRMTYADLKFLRACGICCWWMAGSLLFQNFIHDHGTPEEHSRIRALRVGYPW